MKRKRIFKILKLTFVILLALGFLFVHFIVPRAITKKHSTQKAQTNSKYEYVYDTDKEPKRKRVTFTSFDGTELSGFITFSSLREPKGTIIFLPSSGNTKYSFLEMSETLSKNGYNSVAMDIRGFGESGGKYSTYGVKERKDVQSLIDYLINNEGFDNFGIWGQSLGAAIAMQAMGTEPRLKFGIIESSFTTYKTNMDTFFTRITGLKMQWFTNYIVNRSGSIGDFDADDASPIKYAKHITQPIMVVHGEKDPVFKIKYGKANYDQIKSTDKEFVEIEGAGHINIWKVGGKTYLDKVISFLDEYSSQAK